MIITLPLLLRTMPFLFGKRNMLLAQEFVHQKCFWFVVVFVFCLKRRLSKMFCLAEGFCSKYCEQLNSLTNLIHWKLVVVSAVPGSRKWPKVFGFWCKDTYHVQVWIWPKLKSYLHIHKICKRCFMKIWHLVNSLCVIDGGSFIIKSIAFLTTSGGCQNQSCLTMAILCGMCLSWFMILCSQLYWVVALFS